MRASINQIITFACLLSLPYISKAEEIERYFSMPFQQEIGYAQVVKHNNLLYVSGIIAKGATLEEQLVSVYKALEKTLKSHGSSMSGVLNERISVLNIDDLIKIQKVRRQFYPEGLYPASSWYQVNRLYTPSALIEVEVIATTLVAH
ncbi:RidA family protein [Rheinheimera fenheensis]|uniref:RidA family protein n=1 Tax=Rheinheimera fenheensis TaxID=3152295 RepID=UPI00325D8965